MGRGSVCLSVSPLSQTHRHGQSLPQVHAESAQQIAIPSFRVMEGRERGAGETSRKAGASPDRLASPAHSEKHLARWEAGPVGSLVTAGRQASTPFQNLPSSSPSPCSPTVWERPGQNWTRWRGGHTGCQARPCQPAPHTGAASGSCKELILPPRRARLGGPPARPTSCPAAAAKRPAGPGAPPDLTQRGKPGLRQASGRLSARLIRSSR